MWAFSILDFTSGENSAKLFLSRDRAGEKPLFYEHNLHSFAFSSEAKTLQSNRKLNLDGLNSYLANGYVMNDQCLYDGIEKLPPAHNAILDIQSKTLKTWCYWQLPQDDSSSSKISIQKAAEDVYELLKASVQLRLRCDVPTGIFLSGGLDSSLIVAAARKVHPRNLQAFTVAMTGSHLDEVEYAKQVAQFFDLEHIVLELPKLDLAVIEKLGLLIDEPIGDSSIVPSFLICEQTSNFVKVVLGGDGGDELYGGYPKYQRNIAAQQQYKFVPKSLVQGIAKFASSLPTGMTGRNRLGSLKGGLEEIYVWDTSFFDPIARQRILKAGAILSDGDGFLNPENSRIIHSNETLLRRMMKSDFYSTLPNDYLVKIDRTSMAHGLEVRTPWLDVNLIEHAYGCIPDSMKSTATERRKVQNILAQKYLQPGYQTNRKQGFSIPMGEWLLDRRILELLDKLPSDIFNFDEVSSLISGYKNGRANGSRLFSLVMLAICL